MDWITASISAQCGAAFKSASSLSVGFLTVRSSLKSSTCWHFKQRETESMELGSGVPSPVAQSTLHPQYGQAFSGVDIGSELKPLRRFLIASIVVVRFDFLEADWLGV